MALLLGAPTTGVTTIKNTTTPEAYGAVGNNSGNDDSPAIQAAIAAVVAACIADGSYICEVVFDASKVYYANRAPVSNPSLNGGSSYAYAQICLPYVSWNYSTANPLVTLILRASGHGNMANTASFAVQPCAIRSTVTTGGGFVGGQGSPSVLGGPAAGNSNTPALPNFSGLHVIVDGVNIICPQNPVLMGYDFSGIDAVELLSTAVYVPTTGFGDPTACTTPQAWGVHFPTNNNGGVVRAGSLLVTGFYSGIRAGEHLQITRYEAYSNRIAIEPINGTQTSHIGYFDDVHNQFGFAQNGSTSGAAPVAINLGSPIPQFVIGMWNRETGSPSGTSESYRLHDPNNQMVIVANYVPADGVGHPPSINGGSKARIYDVMRPAGAVTAPSVPATTVALVNPFARDAFVTVNGGTVTAIAVDGQTLGVTSGQVMVPVGKSITLTYSVAPTWTWTVT